MTKQWIAWNEEFGGDMDGSFQTEECMLFAWAVRFNPALAYSCF